MFVGTLMIVDVPARSESITPEWLTNVLATGGVIASSVVTSVSAEDVGGKEAFTGTLARLDVSYSRPEKKAPSSFVAKFAPEDPGLREVMRESNRREVMFYNQIAAGRVMPVPYCYYGDLDPETGASVLLLEELTRLRKVDFLAGCTLADAEVAVAGLARIHAALWDDPKLDEFDWAFSFADAPFGGWWEQYPGKIQTLLPDTLIPNSFIELGELFATQMPIVLNRLEGSPATCIHRDTHVDNLLFGGGHGDPPVVVVDWQWVGRGKAVSDVGYLLISSLPTQLRRRAERRIVETYHGLLVEAGIKGYTFDDCWADYKLSAIAKLFITVAATVLLDNTDDHRRAWRTADLQRLTAFIEDHKPYQHLL